MRREIAYVLGAAAGSSLGVALGSILLGGIGGLLVAAAGGSGLGVAAVFALLPPPSRNPSPSLALVVIARDEERGLPLALASVKGFVDEIVVAVDSRTVDRTREVAPGARVFDLEFKDFAQMRAEAVRAAKSDWILMLDGDETLEGDPRPLLFERVIWQMPRRHWADLDRNVAAPCDDKYPDRQARLFPNDPGIRFEGPVHEAARGLKVKTAPNLVLHHFRDALRSPEILAERERLYKELEERR